MKTRASSGAKDGRELPADRGERDDRSGSFLPLAFHFEGAGLVLAGAALLVTFVATTSLNVGNVGNVDSAGHVSEVGAVSVGVLTGSSAARSAASLASPLFLCGQILVVLGAFFGSLRGDSQRSTLRPRLARLSAALWGVGLALLLTRAPLGGWLAEHVTWGATALRAARWIVTLAALGTAVAVLRANSRALVVRRSLRTIDVGVGLVAVQVVVAIFHNALFIALWDSRLRATHGALELAGGLGLVVAGIGIFTIARSMHHAWIEGAGAVTPRP